MAKGSGILIASASAGSGHLRAGEALRAAFADRDATSRVEHVDVLELGPSWLRRAYGGGFELMASRTPWLWGELYDLTDGEAFAGHWGHAARRLLFRAFEKVLMSGDWGVVVSTHFLPAQLAAGRPGMPPFALVVTDFTLHRWWVQPRVERYFTATRTLADEVRRRVRGARVTDTGIPIAPSFLDALPRAAARAELGLDPKRPVALVMGGGMGLGVEESALAVVEAGVPDLQVAVVTGRNEAARRALEARRLPAERFRIYGHTERIPDFMAAANVVVTKPGGLTLSEALALGRSLVLTRGIPGQEDGNVRALTETGAALYAQGRRGLTDTIRHLFTRPDLLDGLAAAARRIGKSHAAHSIAGMVRREYVLDMVA